MTEEAPTDISHHIKVFFSKNQLGGMVLNGLRSNNWIVAA